MNASQAVTGRPASASVPTQTLQLVGRNIKIPIRSAPNAQGVVTKYLYPGDTVEVKITDSKGFYRLADGSGYINKNTNNVSWKVIDTTSHGNLSNISITFSDTDGVAVGSMQISPLTSPVNAAENLKILGVKYSYFEKFIEENGGRGAFEGKTTAEVNASILCSLCPRLGNVSVCLSLHRQKSSYVGKPAWFVSHAWSYQFLEVVEAVGLTLRRIEGEDKYKDAIVWFDQFTLAHPAPPSLPYEKLHDTFMNSTRSIGKMMLVFDKWDNPTHLTRAWCVFEVYACLSTDSVLEVALTKSENDRFLDTIRWDYQAFYAMLTQINSSKSVARYDEDRDKIHRVIRERIDGGFITLDRRIFSKLENWMIHIIQQQIKETTDLYEKGAWQQALANIFDKLGHPDKAEPLFVASVEAMRTVLGEDSQDTLTAISNLALFYEAIGKFVEAEDLSIKCLDATRRVMGEEHPDTLFSINNLAMLYEGQGKFDLAEPLSVECVELRRRVLGNDDPSTLTSISNLAALYQRQGKFDQAEVLNIECLDSKRRVLGDEHPDTLDSMNNLANVYQSLGKLELAEPLFTECLASRRRLLGSQHPRTRSTISNLAGLYEAIGGEKVPLAIELRAELESLRAGST